MHQSTSKCLIYDDILDAAERIRGFAVRTIAVENIDLNRRAGGRVLLKAECLQRCGAFKFRGAYNAVSRVDQERHPGGVVACSSGNHAQGIAEAARLVGMKAAIVMPSDAPEVKVRGVRDSGAEILPYDRATDDRDAMAAALGEERNAAYIPPYDHPRIIAGQGTVGLEIVEQARELGLQPDHVLAPVSGGGLISGIALAVRESYPDAQIIPVEPAGFDDFARSLAAGEHRKNPRATGSICDALLAATPGRLTFEVARSQLSPGLTVTDDEVLAAIHYAFDRLRLILEPSGAAALAAILAGKLALNGATAVAVLSGGNIDRGVFLRALGVGANTGR